MPAGLTIISTGIADGPTATGITDRRLALTSMGLGFAPGLPAQADLFALRALLGPAWLAKRRRGDQARIDGPRRAL